jgi:hypothetical protein
MSIGAIAASNLEEVKAYLNKSISIELYGKDWTPKDEDGNTLYPITYNGNTYLPVRAVGEAAGVKVGWNGNTQTVYLGDQPVEEIISPPEPEPEPVPAGPLYVVDGTGDYSGYQQLKGFTDEDKYEIYFKGKQSSFHTTIEVLNEVDLNEKITWEYNGRSLTHTRSQLYAFFSDTSKLRSLLDVSSQTLSHTWFEETFGDVYWEWLDGISYSEDASRWVEKYFRQINPPKSNVTLTPDAKVIVEKGPEEPTLEKTMEEIQKANEKKIPDEVKGFDELWIGERELNEDYGVSFYPYMLNEIIFVDQKSNTIFTMTDVLAAPEANKAYTSNGVGYQYVSSNSTSVSGYQFSGVRPGFYFSREGLKKVGVID